MTELRSSSAGRGLDAPTFNGVEELLEDSRSRLARVSPRAAYQEVLSGRAVLVDIRPQAQRDQEGQVHPDLAPVVIERNVLEWRLDPRHPSSLPVADLGLRVIVICQEGYASSLAADVLLRLGLHRACDVVGGFAAWCTAGLPRREGQVEHGQQHPGAEPDGNDRIVSPTSPRSNFSRSPWRE